MDCAGSGSMRSDIAAACGGKKTAARGARSARDEIPWQRAGGQSDLLHAADKQSLWPGLSGSVGMVGGNGLEIGLRNGGILLMLGNAVLKWPPKWPPNRAVTPSRGPTSTPSYWSRDSTRAECKAGSQATSASRPRNNLSCDIRLCPPPPARKDQNPNQKGGLSSEIKNLRGMRCRTALPLDAPEGPARGVPPVPPVPCASNGTARTGFRLNIYVTLRLVVQLSPPLSEQLPCMQTIIVFTRTTRTTRATAEFCGFRRYGFACRTRTTRTISGGKAGTGEEGRAEAGPVADCLS